MQERNTSQILSSSTEGPVLAHEGIVNSALNLGQI